MITLRAMFGQDEASHGAMRYRVGPGGIVVVPRAAAEHLLKRGGFAAVPGFCVLPFDGLTCTRSGAVPASELDRSEFAANSGQRACVPRGAEPALEAVKIIQAESGRPLTGGVSEVVSGAQ